MNAFLAKLETVDKKVRYRSKLEILQVNMGNLCNQRCRHCHVNASPEGKNIMSKETIDDVLRFLSKDESLVLDLTGGAPEMNPDFRYFVTSARPLVKEIIVRSNLTVIFEPGKEYLPNFYRDNKVHLICSMPCYTKENVDAQRGSGVFEKSVQALNMLNDIGYGKDPSLRLDLVYNPGGAFLPGPQEQLEADYKKKLKGEHEIEFNNLLTITNAPIKRFKEQLEEEDEYDGYMELLEDNFNENVVENIMCRTLLNICWDGMVYDCDFNEAMGMALTDESGDKLNIKDLSPEELEGREILFADHCFCCTAGSGSSCQGALKGSSTAEGDLKKTRGMVSEYYGETLSSSDDLKTSVCCNIESIPPHVRRITSLIEPEITEKFYGCGSPIPLELESMSVLDLGCGTGKDTYVISALAGEKGKVIGVDMTQQQLDVAGKYLDVQTEKFGLRRPNVEFLRGYIEDLKSIGITDGRVDVVVSNCVVNLSARKDLVFSEVHRVLKEGGEFYFSDVFVDRRLPAWTKEDPVLVGECLGGALYWKDFERMAVKAGFNAPRIYSMKPIAISSPEVKERIGFANFSSITYRLFKIKNLEDACENYGQEAGYLGGIAFSEEEFRLDDHHLFKKGEAVPVCGNTADMLRKTRFGKYFKVTGDKSEHHGIFPGCEASGPFTDFGKGADMSGTCCS